MPPRRPPRPTPPDVDVLRAGLGQGKIVRVGIAPSDQFPDGVTGRVRRIGDPAVDGDEFLFVEVPVGGTKDVLPFATKDLTTTPARKPAVPAHTPVTAADGRVRPPASTAGRSAAAPTLALVPNSAGPSRLAAQPAAQPAARPAAQPAASALPTESLPEVGVTHPQPAGPARRTAPKNNATTGRGKRAPVTITISTAGDESAAWRIEARIGAKPAVRPTVIPPSRVWEIVQTLGEPRLTEVVQTLLDDHRRSTQARADALAAELSSLQAELNSFPSH